MNVFIRRYKDHYHWFAIEAEQSMQEYQGNLDELAAFYRQNGQVKNWVLVAPALDTAQRSIGFTPKERRHIAKAIPFLLEDDLLSDASDLHYVADKPGADHVDVVAIDKTVLAGWLQELDEVGVHPTHCLPEVKLLLDDGSSDWQVFYREHEFIVRSANGQCTAYEQAHFPLVTGLLTDNYAQLPRKVELIADTEQLLQEAWESMPDALRPLVEAKTLPYAAMVQDRFSRHAKVWNFLHGQFAYSQQWLARFMPWRWVVISLVAVCLLHVAMTLVEYRQLENENRRLRAETEAVFREAFPKGQLVDARRQFENELEKLQSGGGGRGFMQRLQTIGEVFSRHQVQSFNSITFEKEKNEIRIDVLVTNYDKLQEIINELQQAGLTSEIQNSNAQGDQLRARIRITG